MTSITLEFLNSSQPSAKTFKSPDSLEKWIKLWWHNHREYVSPETNYWEYLENTNIFFGENVVSVINDNSTFVEGCRCAHGFYEIYFGVPALYKTYHFKSAKSFFRNGERLRRLVDKLGQARMLEILRNH